MTTTDATSPEQTANLKSLLYSSAPFQVLKENVGLLGICVTIAYGLGWFSQVSGLASLGVGEIAPMREKSIVTGLVLMIILAPFLMYLYVPWQRLGKAAWFHFAFGLCTQVLVLCLTEQYIIDPMKSYGTDRGKIALFYLLSGLFIMVRKYENNENLIKSNFLVILAVGIASSKIYPSIAKVEFGGFSETPVVVKLDNGSQTKLNLIAEDNNWIVFRQATGAKQTLKIAKARVIQIESQKVDKK